MSESMPELIKRHNMAVPFRVEIHMAWKASGTQLGQDEWVAKFLPDKFDAYLEARRVAEIVFAEDERIVKERRESMSELEKLHEKMMPIAMEIVDLYAESGTRMPQEKWVAKYLPERLDEYNKADEVWFAVLEERARLKAEREQAEKGAKS